MHKLPNLKKIPSFWTALLQTLLDQLVSQRLQFSKQFLRRFKRFSVGHVLDRGNEQLVANCWPHVDKLFGFMWALQIAVNLRMPIDRSEELSVSILKQ